MKNKRKKNEKFDQHGYFGEKDQCIRPIQSKHGVQMAL